MTLIWLQHLYAYGVLLVFILIQLAFGITLLRLPVLGGFSFHNHGERLYMAFLLGLYTTISIMTLFALIGLFNTAGLICYALAGAACVTPVCSGAYRAWRTSRSSKLQSAPMAIRRKFLLALLILGLLVWLVPYGLQSLLPNADWDAAVYHLPLAKLYLEKGIWWSDPLLPAYQFPGGISLVYGLLMLVNGQSAIIPLNLVTTLLLTLAPYFLARRLWNPTAGLWAVLVCLSFNIILELGLDPRNDNFLALFCFTALYALLVSYQSASSRNKPGCWLIVFGMMLGLALSTKYTAIFFVVVLVPLVFVLGFITRATNQRMWPVVSKWIVLLSVAGMLLPSTVWYMRNTIHLGDPIYPWRGLFYQDESGNRQYLEQNLSHYLETERTNPAFQKLYTNIQKSTVPKNLLRIDKMLRFPAYFTQKPYHFLSPFILLSILLPLLRRDKFSLLLWSISLVLWCIFAYKTYLMRFLLPLLPALSVCVGGLLSRFRAWWWCALWGISLCLVLGYNNHIEWQKFQRVHAWAYISGQLSYPIWLAKIGYNSTPAMPILIDQINQSIARGKINPRNAIFMIAEGKGYLLKCSYLPDHTRIGNTWLVEFLKARGDLNTLAVAMKQHGFQYVLLNRAHFHWIMQGYGHTLRETCEIAIFSFIQAERFLAQHTREIYNKNGLTLGHIQ